MRLMSRWDVLVASTAPGRATVQLGEHRQLDVHVLEHGLDDQVGLVQRVIRDGALPAAMRAVRSSSLMRPLPTSRA